MNNRDMPAMAQSIAVTEYGGLHTVGEEFSGLTKREQAAIQIMAAFGSDPECTGKLEDIAKSAVEWADALFAELDKRGGE